MKCATGVESPAATGARNRRKATVKKPATSDYSLDPYFPFQDLEENEKCQQEDERAEKKKRELPQQEVDSSRKKSKLVQECHSEVNKMRS